ncbi:MAG: hypothetical protein KAU26_02180 [Methylococcales bacterium]|nr:hypothetical protein [Methylococcales bacterium]
MFNKHEYLKIIEHSKCRDGNIEKSDLTAFKIDDADGIAEEIGFKCNMISKVDYFLEKDIDVQLIEMSDLRQNLQDYNTRIKENFAKIAEEDIHEKYKREKRKQAKKEAWKSLKDEFCKKWNGSIAVIERFYRKTNKLDDNPNYRLLIVCKNETDVRMLDDLTSQLNGMMGEQESVKVCTTKILNKYLIV